MMWPVIKNRTINARRDRDLALDNKSISSFSQVCFLFPLFFARKILLLDQYWQNNKLESVAMSVLPTVWWYYTTNFTHKQRLGSAQGILPVSWWQESVTALSATEGSGGLTSDFSQGILLGVCWERYQNARQATEYHNKVSQLGLSLNIKLEFDENFP